MRRKRTKVRNTLLHPMFRWIQDPEIRQYDVQLAKQRKRNTDRPLDVAVSDYLHGPDLLWKKLYGDRETPANWSWKEARPPRSQIHDGELPKWDVMTPLDICHICAWQFHASATTRALSAKTTSSSWSSQ